MSASPTAAHRHFHDELSELKAKLLTMSGEAQDALGRALDALLRRDSDMAARVIARDRPGGEVAVAEQQGVERAAQGVLGFARHGQELGLQLRQLVVKVAVCRAGRGAHPNRPVM